jgi:hypothetical protein
MDDDKKTAKLGLVSKIIVLTTAALWAIWDVIPAIWHGRNDTISENIRNWARGIWVLPFFWGILTSHFFINIGQPENYQTRFYIAASIILGVIGVNLATYFAVGWESPVWFRIVVLFTGMVLGIILWAQNP